MNAIAKKLNWLAPVVLVFIMSGCGYSIKYDLNPTKAERAKGPLSLKVAVMSLDDTRPRIEREKNARKSNGDKDVGDYTYDKNFRKDVAWGCTEMMTKHLDWAKSFDEVESIKLSSKTLDPAMLDSLAAAGIDAVMTGELHDFYGYYDKGSVILPVGLALAVAIPVALATTETKTSGYGISEVQTNPLAVSLAAYAGGAAGNYLASSSKRRIQWRTKLSVRLQSTADGSILWEGLADVAQDHKASMPGINTDKRKQQVAVESLRSAVNQLIMQLSKSEFASKNISSTHASR